MFGLVVFGVSGAIQKYSNSIMKESSSFDTYRNTK